MSGSLRSRISAILVGLALLLATLSAAAAPSPVGLPGGASPIEVAESSAALASSAPEPAWLELGWLELEDEEARHAPERKVAAFPPTGLPEPLRQGLLLLALAGIALSLRRL